MIQNSRRCYARGSDNTVIYYNGRGQLWYLNRPTDFVLCNRCYCYYIKNPRHNTLVSDGGDYSSLHEWIRKNRPKPSGVNGIRVSNDNTFFY